MSSSSPSPSPSSSAVNGAGRGGTPQPGKSSAAGAGKALDGQRKQNGSPVDGASRKQSTPQTKAWQGPNPITQRATSGMTNGTEKPLPKLPPQAHDSPKSDGTADKHAHDRLLFAMANCMGSDATVTLKSGEQFSGVFFGASFDQPAKSRYLLKMVKRTRPAGGPQMNGDSEHAEEYIGEGEDHAMAFDAQDTASLAVNGVVTAAAPPAQNGSINSSSFRTDTEISGRDPTKPRQRELQRWDAGADDSLDLSLESSGATGWDQFATNERLYDAKYTYDENMYTTAIDRSNPQYAQREAEAARIAREMEGNPSRPAHNDLDDGLDEEDKYSGVRREPAQPSLPKRSGNAYVPPGQRPITNQPTVPGAPFDPAIISVERPPPQPATAPTEPAAPAEPTPTLPERPKIVAPEATPSRDVSGGSSAAQAQTQPKAAKAANNTQDHISNTVDAFKQFANLEKLKIKQAQEQKRAAGRQEKNVKLNDLKKFAANFKLQSRVPDDLVPILAKDREKQVEIQRKAEEAAKEAEAAKAKARASSSSTAATPSPASGSEARAAFAPSQSQSQQQTRQKVSQQGMRTPSMQQNQTQSPRGPMTRGPQPLQRQQMQPLNNIQIPTGPAMSSNTPLSPGSARGINVNATTFTPSAAPFQPAMAATSVSPKRKISTDKSASFFKSRPRLADADRKDPEGEDHDIIVTMLAIEYKGPEAEMAKKNGGVLPPYRTLPTWTGIENTSYKDSFPKIQHGYPPHMSGGSNGVSPLHTPGPGGPGMMGMMPGPQTHHPGAPMQHQPPFPQQYPGPHHQQPHPGHQHMMPGPPNGVRGPQAFYTPGPPQMQHHPGAYGMPQFGGAGPNGNNSIQNSPRFPNAQVAPYGGMPQMGMMPQFAGQPHGGAPYGMSPSMAARQLPGGYGGGPPQQPPRGASFGPGPGQFPQQGGMMMPNGGPPFGQQGFPSPMPHHSTPGPYNQSPRPAMMSHQNSSQGFTPGGPQGGMGFPPGQGGPHPGHFAPQWQRQMSSGGYGQQGGSRQGSMGHSQGSSGGQPQGVEEGKGG